MHLLTYNREKRALSHSKLGGQYVGEVDADQHEQNSGAHQVEEGSGQQIEVTQDVDTIALVQGTVTK